MPSLTAVMLHNFIKGRMDKIYSAILAAPTMEEKIAVYRRETALEVGSVILGDYRAVDAELAGRPVTWIVHDDFPKDKVVLFLHGGGYIGGTVYNSRNQAADIAKCAKQKVVSLDYRLAPEHPYPAALHDLLAVYQALQDRGYKTDSISFLGESAGGGLALAGVLSLKQAGLPLPGAVVGLSPWCDLTMQQITFRANKDKDIMLQPDFLAVAAELYTAGQDRTDPLISPIYGDFTGFPPLLLQVATEELLLGEVIAVANQAEKSGVKVNLDIFDGMWHVWQTLDEIVPESRMALEIIGSFIQKYTGSSSESADQATSGAGGNHARTKRKKSRPDPHLLR